MYNAKLSALHGKPASAQSLTSAANIANFLAFAKVKVKRLAFAVNTAVVSTGNVVVNIYYRPVPGSGSTANLVATLNIPNGAAAGTVYYKDVAGQVLQPGEELACDVATAAAGGSAAGAGYFFAEEVEESPDVVLNYSNHVASS